MTVAFESIGGVDAARRVRAGDAFDVVVLASNVIAELEHEGAIIAGSGTPIARSGVAVAVRAGTPHPVIATEDDVKRAVLGATICYSSGPSGTHLKRLFARWGIDAEIADRTVEAKPGVPVAHLIAQGAADLGFQQRSELLDIAGVEIVGPLPPSIQTITTFSAGIAQAASNAGAARSLIAHLASPETMDVKLALGFE